jgi:hypothetical protein
MSTDRAGLFYIRACNCNLTRLSRLLRILQFYALEAAVFSPGASKFESDLPGSEDKFESDLPG